MKSIDIRDVRAGGRYNGKTVLAVEQLHGGIVMHFRSGDSKYLQGKGSTVLIDESYPGTGSSDSGIYIDAAGMLHGVVW